MRCALLLALLLAACGNEQVRKPTFHSPLLRSSWEPLAPRQTPPRDEDGKSDADDSTADGSAAANRDLRQEMVARARALLGQTAQRKGYGAGDAEQLLSELIPGLTWRASYGLNALVEQAERSGAFATDGDPTPGDIVLFHNQVDANGNGEVDDWLTGCGVVIARDGPRFEVLVRTGHAPRSVTAWPEGPSVRKLEGRLVNSFVRVPHPSDADDVEYLAGALYAGHIDLEGLADSASGD